MLERVAVVSGRHYRAVLTGAAILTVIAVALATRLHLDTDILNLLPRKDPVIRNFIEATQRFGGVDYLLVVVRVPEGKVVEPYEELTDRLGERLAKLPEFSKVEHRIGDPEELLRELFPKAVLFLDDAELTKLGEQLTPAGLNDRAAELARQLTTPQGTALKELLKLDPFGLANLLLGRVEQTRGSLAVDWASGYYLSRDHRLLLILGTPVKPPQDTDFDVALVAAVEREIAAARAEWPEILPGATGDAPEVVAGGTYVTALDDYRQIRRDVVLNVISSAALVLLLFQLAFRRLSALIYAIVPLVCGILWTFGFAAATLGKLSSATSGTAALLIGLSIDFVIVTYGRYVEERQRGAEVEAALTVTARSTGRGVLFGTITTVATFFAFAVTDFRGLREMGLLAGTGIIFCAIAVAVILPALIAWGEARHRHRDSVPNLYLHSFGTTGLMRWCTRHPWAALAVGAVITLAASLSATRLQFDEGMSAMRAQGSNRGIELGKEVAHHFQSGFDAMMLVVRGQDLRELFAGAEQAAAAAESLKRDGVILGYSGLTSLVPSPERQQRVIQWLAAGRANGLLDPARLEQDFAAALAAEGLRTAPFERGLALFGQAIAPTRPASPQEFVADQQAASQLLGRYLRKDPDGTLWSVVYLYPPLNKWRREPPPQAVAVASTLGPNIYLTGPNVMNEFMRRRVKRDAVIAALLGLAVVIGLLYVDFRRSREVVLALAPLAVGIIWMLGGMALFEIRLNFMNVFVTTMIIGIGVDYGIHAMHRYREMAGAGAAERQAGAIETGKAIVVAALSTVVGFGSLATSGFPGLRTTGYVAILGAASTALVAITLLPACVELLAARKLSRVAKPVE